MHDGARHWPSGGQLLALISVLLGLDGSNQLGEERQTDAFHMRGNDLVFILWV